MTESRRLKNIDGFKSVFIHRDLTYKQIEVLRVRREANRGTQQPEQRRPTQTPAEGAVAGTGFLTQ